MRSDAGPAWTIAKKEIHENLVSLRFVLLLALAVVFIPASLYTNYRQVLSAEVFDRIFVDMFPGGQMKMGLLRPIDLRTLPEFRLHPAPVRDTLRGVDLAILLAWFLGAGALVFRALGRYDVR